MANTVIQLKYSNVTSQPPTLNVAEPAYSNVSGVLWIDDGSGVVAIGGKSYTTRIDNATASPTANTIALRDLAGNVSFNFVTANGFKGNADTATSLLNGRNFSIDGSDVDSAAVSFNGTSNVVLQGNLKTTGVSSGTYGGTANVPVFTVDTKGRISYAANVSISTNLSIAADTGINTISLLTETLTVAGGDGITTSIDPTDTIKIDVDNTVIRTTGNQTISGDLSLTGNLTISGNVTSIGVQSLNVTDPVIFLAANNTTSDIVDIGFVGHYNESGSNNHFGIVRKAATNDAYIFTGYNEEFVTNTLNLANPSLVYANVHANLIGKLVSSNVGSFTEATIGTLTLTNDLSVGNGGTGQSSFTTGSILVGNGSGALGELSNTSSAGTYGNTTHVPVITVDNYGRVSGVTNTSITALVNGNYNFTLESSGQITTNATSILLANGAIIKDTADSAVAFGEFAGTLGQGAQAVAIGESAGYNTQGAYGIAIGYGAGNQNQGQVAIAIGLNAGVSAQGYNGIAIGGSSGINQGQYAIAMGYDTGGSQGEYSVAIGNQAGKGNTTSIGVNSIAIGNKAGFESGAANSIVLNASGNNLSASQSGFYVNPIRFTATQDATYDGFMIYNASTKEIRYTYTISGGTF
jgi:hypothetical protein